MATHSQPLNPIMKLTHLAPALALTLIITATALLAQVPQLPNYQRRVAVASRPIRPTRVKLPAAI
jgi:hypothetical protein